MLLKMKQFLDHYFLFFIKIVLLPQSQRVTDLQRLKNMTFDPGDCDTSDNKTLVMISLVILL